MPFYHVAIAKKSGRVRWTFGFDMSKDQVEEEVVKPFKQQQQFMCGTRVIHPPDIEYIVISETEEPSSQILAKSRKKRVLKKTLNLLARSEGEEEEPVDEWNIIHAGKNVTKEFMHGISLPKETPPPRPQIKKDTVFIVHGREHEQALLLQKYLNNKLKVKAVVFDDLPNKGRTVIEQLEYIRDHVYHAFVIVTPDDVGCLREEIESIAKMTVGLKTVSNEIVSKIFKTLNERARQNVVFELGLFIGALGREHVCYLLQKSVKEKPTDIDGILYKQFDKSVTEVFHEIAEELS